MRAPAIGRGATARSGTGARLAHGLGRVRRSQGGPPPRHGTAAFVSTGVGARASTTARPLRRWTPSAGGAARIPRPAGCPCSSRACRAGSREPGLRLVADLDGRPLAGCRSFERVTVGPGLRPSTGTSRGASTTRTRSASWRATPLYDTHTSPMVSDSPARSVRFRRPRDPRSRHRRDGSHRQALAALAARAVTA